MHKELHTPATRPSSDYALVDRSTNGQWFWTVVAPNGRKIATSGETFTRKASAIRAASRATGLNTYLRT